MRDILTVIAGLVIVVLAAALIAPPLIDWEAHRPAIERAIGRATGVEAKTDGRIEVRLLPSPRIRVDGLRLGSATPDAPSLTARYIWAEVALTPLLRGDVRFTETRVGRAEIRVPTSGDGRWQVPDATPGSRRDWAIEDLRIAQLLLTTTTPTTGRTDQFYAEGVQLEGQSLAGPWRAEGMTAGVPFRLVTGELTADSGLQIKLTGGGDIHPRFDIDARLALGPNADGGLKPTISGSARLLFGPPAQVAAAGIPLPVAVQTAFKSEGSSVELDPLVVEAGEGGASLRLSGTGSVRLDDPRVSVKLSGRRLDVDSFVLSASGQEFLNRKGSWSLPPTSTPIDLDVTLNSIGLAQDEIADLALRASLLKGVAVVDRIEFVAPGQTRIALQGEVGLTTQGGANGRVALSSVQSDRFGRYLAKLGLSGPFLSGLDGRALEAAADMVLASPVVSFRNARVKIGDAALTGNVRFTAPEAGARGKLEAQIGVQNLDLAALPKITSVFDATQNMDIGFILDAREVRHGDRPGAGRIAARILSDGPALVVERLEIADLAGANANVAGRIGADGAGRIEGRVTAQRAAPLVDLLGTVWIGGVSKLVPYFLREGELDLNVVAERPPPDPTTLTPRLRTTARGTAAGGKIEVDALAADGATESLTVRVATDNTGRWVDRPDSPMLRRPSNLELRGVRVASGDFNLTLAGDVGGVKISTSRPVALGQGDDVVDSGEADLTSPDVTPFLTLLGDGAGVEPPVPIQVHVTLGRERDASLLMVSGRVAGGAVQARLSTRSRSNVSGSVTLDRLSMPWLAASFALNAPADPRATSLWSTQRFGQTRRVIDGGQASFKVSRVDFGRGLEGENASFTLAITPEGIAIRDFEAGLAGGRIAGTLAIARQGTLASFVGEGSVKGAALPKLMAGPFDGRLTGTLRFGASGETFSSVVANLAGVGDLQLIDFRAPNGDPAALQRALPRVLADADPLGAGRLQAIVTSELGRGPLRAAALTAPVTLVGGAIRLSPVAADLGPASWRGSAALDLKTLALDARGTLAAAANPAGWNGAPPSIGLGWRGPLAVPAREVDIGSLTNGVAALVLQRELAKIEAFEADRNERSRRIQRADMDRARRIAEEAARRAAEETARRAEEAVRQAQIREQRAAEEAARQARLREQAEAERRRAQENTASTIRQQAPSLPQPLEIRPEPQIRPQPGG